MASTIEASVALIVAQRNTARCLRDTSVSTTAVSSGNPMMNNSGDII